jgi:hypothetical protein
VASLESLNTSFNNLKSNYDLEKEISKKIMEDNRTERVEYEAKGNLYLEVNMHVCIFRYIMMHLCLCMSEFYIHMYVYMYGCVDWKSRV